MATQGFKATIEEALKNQQWINVEELKKQLDQTATTINTFGENAFGKVSEFIEKGTKQATAYHVALKEQNVQYAAIAKIVEKLAPQLNNLFVLSQAGSYVGLLKDLVIGLKAVSDQARGTQLALEAMVANGFDVSNIQRVTSIFSSVLTPQGAKEIALAAQREYLDRDASERRVNTILSPEQQAENPKIIKQSVTNLGNSVTSAQALDIQYEVISAGFTKAADSARVLEAAIQLTKVGFADASETGRLLVTTMQAYGQSAEQAATTAAKLQGIVETGITTIPELAMVFGQVASLANQAGVSIDDLGAAIAVLTQKGIRTPIAATSLQSLFSNIVNMSPEAEKALKKFSAQAKETLDFSPETIRMEGFVSVMQKVSKVTGGSLNKLAQLFPDAQAFRAAVGLLSDGGKKLEQFSESIGNKTAQFLEDKFNLVLGSQRESFVQIVNTAKEILEDLGKELTPVFEFAVRGLKEVVEGFKKLPPEVKTATAVIIAFNVGLGTLAGIITTLIGTVAAFAAGLLAIRGVGIAYNLTIGQIVNQKSAMVQRLGEATNAGNALGAVMRELVGINSAYSTEVAKGLKLGLDRVQAEKQAIAVLERKRKAELENVNAIRETAKATEAAAAAERERNSIEPARVQRLQELEAEQTKNLSVRDQLRQEYELKKDVMSDEERQEYQQKISNIETAIAAGDLEIKQFQPLKDVTQLRQTLEVEEQTYREKMKSLGVQVGKRGELQGLEALPKEVQEEARNLNRTFNRDQNLRLLELDDVTSQTYAMRNALDGRAGGRRINLAENLGTGLNAAFAVSAGIGAISGGVGLVKDHMYNADPNNKEKKDMNPEDIVNTGIMGLLAAQQTASVLSNPGIREAIKSLGSNFGRTGGGVLGLLGGGAGLIGSGINTAAGAISNASGWGKSFWGLPGAIGTQLGGMGKIGAGLAAGGSIAGAAATAGLSALATWAVSRPTGMLVDSVNTGNYVRDINAPLDAYNKATREVALALERHAAKQKENTTAVNDSTAAYKRFVKNLNEETINIGRTILDYLRGRLGEDVDTYLDSESNLRADRPAEKPSQFQQWLRNLKNPFQRDPNARPPEEGSISDILQKSWKNTPIGGWIEDRLEESGKWIWGQVTQQKPSEKERAARAAAEFAEVLDDPKRYAELVRQGQQEFQRIAADDSLGSRLFGDGLSYQLSAERLQAAEKRADEFAQIAARAKRFGGFASEKDQQKIAEQVARGEEISADLADKLNAAGEAAVKDITKQVDRAKQGLLDSKKTFEEWANKNPGVNPLNTEEGRILVARVTESERVLKKLEASQEAVTAASQGTLGQTTALNQVASNIKASKEAKGSLAEYLNEQVKDTVKGFREALAKELKEARQGTATGNFVERITENITNELESMMDGLEKGVYTYEDLIKRLDAISKLEIKPGQPLLSAAQQIDLARKKLELQVAALKEAQDGIERQVALVLRTENLNLTKLTNEYNKQRTVIQSILEIEQERVKVNQTLMSGLAERIENPVLQNIASSAGRTEALIQGRTELNAAERLFAMKRDQEDQESRQTIGQAEAQVLKARNELQQAKLLNDSLPDPQKKAQAQTTYNQVATVFQARQTAPRTDAEVKALQDALDALKINIKATKDTKVEIPEAIMKALQKTYDTTRTQLSQPPRTKAEQQEIRDNYAAAQLAVQESEEQLRVVREQEQVQKRLRQFEEERLRIKRLEQDIEENLNKLLEQRAKQQAKLNESALEAQAKLNAIQGASGNLSSLYSEMRGLASNLPKEDQQKINEEAIKVEYELMQQRHKLEKELMDMEKAKFEMLLERQKIELNIAKIKLETERDVAELELERLKNSGTATKEELEQAQRKLDMYDRLLTKQEELADSFVKDEDQQRRSFRNQEQLMTDRQNAEDAIGRSRVIVTTAGSDQASQQSAATTARNILQGAIDRQVSNIRGRLNPEINRGFDTSDNVKFTGNIEDDAESIRRRQEDAPPDPNKTRVIPGGVRVRDVNDPLRNVAPEWKPPAPLVTVPDTQVPTTRPRTLTELLNSGEYNVNQVKPDTSRRYPLPTPANVGDNLRNGEYGLREPQPSNAPVTRTKVTPFLEGTAEQPTKTTPQKAPTTGRKEIPTKRSDFVEQDDERPTVFDSPETDVTPAMPEETGRSKFGGGRSKFGKGSGGGAGGGSKFGGGGMNIFAYNTNHVSDSFFTVITGAGGAGGDAVTTDDTNGNAGTNGGATTVRLNSTSLGASSNQGTVAPNNGGTNAAAPGHGVFTANSFSGSTGATGSTGNGGNVDNASISGADGGAGGGSKFGGVSGGGRSKFGGSGGAGGGGGGGGGGQQEFHKKGQQPTPRRTTRVPLPLQSVELYPMGSSREYPTLNVKPGDVLEAMASGADRFGPKASQRGIQEVADAWNRDMRNLSPAALARRLRDAAGLTPLAPRTTPLPDVPAIKPGDRRLPTPRWKPPETPGTPETKPQTPNEAQSKRITPTRRGPVDREAALKSQELETSVWGKTGWKPDPNWVRPNWLAPLNDVGKYEVRFWGEPEKTNQQGQKAPTVEPHDSRPSKDARTKELNEDFSVTALGEILNHTAKLVTNTDEMTKALKDVADRGKAQSSPTKIPTGAMQPKTAYDTGREDTTLTTLTGALRTANNRSTIGV